jgi:hypothetical protein
MLAKEGNVDFNPTLGLEQAPGDAPELPPITGAGESTNYFALAWER